MSLFLFYSVTTETILFRSVSELEEQQTPSDENLSENRSELVPIFESHGIPEGLVIF